MKEEDYMIIISLRKSASIALKIWRGMSLVCSQTAVGMNISLIEFQYS